MLKALLLTVIIEIPLLMAFGLRDRGFLCLAVFANIMTNVGINALLLIEVYLFSGSSMLNGVYWASVAVLEAAVVIIEYLIYEAYLHNGGRTLFLKVFAVNVASFCIGLLIPSVRNIAESLPDWSFLFVF